MMFGVLIWLPCAGGGGSSEDAPPQPTIGAKRASARIDRRMVPSAAHWIGDAHVGDAAARAAVAAAGGAGSAVVAHLARARAEMRVGVAQGRAERRLQAAHAAGVAVFADALLVAGVAGLAAAE